MGFIDADQIRNNDPSMQPAENSTASLVNNGSEPTQLPTDAPDEAKILRFLLTSYLR
jgi:hypothetical protein